MKIEEIQQLFCFYCKSEKSKESRASKLVEFDDNLIIIKNIPCLECEQCGVRYYEDEVVERLEMLVAETKKIIQEVSIIDYSKAA